MALSPGNNYSTPVPVKPVSTLESTNASGGAFYGPNGQPLYGAARPATPGAPAPVSAAKAVTPATATQTAASTSGTTSATVQAPSNLVPGQSEENNTAKKVLDNMDNMEAPKEVNGTGGLGTQINLTPAMAARLAVIDSSYSPPATTAVTGGVNSNQIVDTVFLKPGTDPAIIAYITKGNASGLSGAASSADITNGRAPGNQVTNAYQTTRANPTPALTSSGGYSPSTGGVGKATFTITETKEAPAVSGISNLGVSNAFEAQSLPTKEAAYFVAALENPAQYALSLEPSGKLREQLAINAEQALSGKSNQGVLNEIVNKGALNPSSVLGLGELYAGGEIAGAAVGGLAGAADVGKFLSNSDVGKLAENIATSAKANTVLTEALEPVGKAITPGVEFAKGLVNSVESNPKAAQAIGKAAEGVIVFGQPLIPATQTFQVTGSKREAATVYTEGLAQNIALFGGFEKGLEIAPAVSSNIGSAAKSISKAPGEFGKTLYDNSLLGQAGQGLSDLITTTPKEEIVPGLSSSEVKALTNNGFSGKIEPGIFPTLGESGNLMELESGTKTAEAVRAKEFEEPKTILVPGVDFPLPKGGRIEVPLSPLTKEELGNLDTGLPKLGETGNILELENGPKTAEAIRAQNFVEPKTELIPGIDFPLPKGGKVEVPLSPLSKEELANLNTGFPNLGEVGNLLELESGVKTAEAVRAKEFEEPKTILVPGVDFPLPKGGVFEFPLPSEKEVANQEAGLPNLGELGNILELESGSKTSQAIKAKALEDTLFENPKNFEVIFKDGTYQIRELKETPEPKGGLTSGSNEVETKNGQVQLIKQEPKDLTEQTVAKSKTDVGLRERSLGVEPKAVSKRRTFYNDLFEQPILTIQQAKEAKSFGFIPLIAVLPKNSSATNQSLSFSSILPSVTTTFQSQTQDLIEPQPKAIGSESTSSIQLQRFGFGFSSGGSSEAQAEKQSFAQDLIQPQEETSTSTQTETVALNPYQVTVPKTSENKKKKPVKERELGFIVFGRRNGKEISLFPRPLTFREAEEAGKEFALGGLGQTFRIKPVSGEAQPGFFKEASQSEINQLFRQPKPNSKLLKGGGSVFVERNPLGTPQEVREIQNARGSKSKGFFSVSNLLK